MGASNYQLMVHQGGCQELGEAFFPGFLGRRLDKCGGDVQESRIGGRGTGLVGVESLIIGSVERGFSGEICCGPAPATLLSLSLSPPRASIVTLDLFAEEHEEDAQRPVLHGCNRPVKFI